MADPSKEAEDTLKEVADNPGARAAATDSNPLISLEEARNAAAGEGPNASGGPATSTSEEHVPSTSEPFATDIPSANMPNPEKQERHPNQPDGSSKSPFRRQ
jgi:hypothetical protein